MRQVVSQRRRRRRREVLIVSPLELLLMVSPSLWGTEGERRSNGWKRKKEVAVKKSNNLLGISWRAKIKIKYEIES